MIPPRLAISRRSVLMPVPCRKSDRTIHFDLHSSSITSISPDVTIGHANDSWRSRRNPTSFTSRRKYDAVPKQMPRPKAQSISNLVQLWAPSIALSVFLFCFVGHYFPADLLWHFAIRLLSIHIGAYQGLLRHCCRYQLHLRHEQRLRQLVQQLAPTRHRHGAPLYLST